MSKSTTQKSQSVLKFTHEDAQDYFLESKSYCNFDLPIYFDFEDLLLNVHEKLSNEKLKKINASNYEGVNYKILDNKDGRYAWRPLQLIHPVLYVSLVHQITDKENWDFIRERFDFFAQDNKIECVSIPRESLTDESDKAEQVLNWWHKMEQRSLEVALDYKYLTHTDITDCYGAIYTHSVAWALFGKKHMKDNKHDDLCLGNIIDRHLQGMSHGQTNGIPQGSALMDFIAEMVLGYADSLLLEKILEESEIKDYKILRYRDDYRIFTNNPRDGEYILKYLTEIMIGLGLKLSVEKTKSSSDVITSSIKSDKLYWVKQKQNYVIPYKKKDVKKKNEKDEYKRDYVNPQKSLLIIHGLAKEYPNSGSLIVALHKFYLSLKDVKIFRENTLPLISILVDIAYNNPRTYPYFATIVSFLLDQVSYKDQKKYLKRIVTKFEDIPNTGHLFVWLQRIALGIEVEMDFDEKLCQLIPNRDNDLWNNSWLPDSIKNEMKADFIINRDVIAKLSAVISREEIALFKDNYKGSY